MDNDTKLTREQLDAVLSKLKSDTQPKKNDINDFVEKNLTEQQAQALNKALDNPDLIKSLLASPQAKSLMKKILSGGKDG